MMVFLAKSGGTDLIFNIMQFLKSAVLSLKGLIFSEIICILNYANKLFKVVYSNFLNTPERYYSNIVQKIVKVSFMYSYISNNFITYFCVILVINYVFRYLRQAGCDSLRQRTHIRPLLRIFPTFSNHFFFAELPLFYLLRSSEIYSSSRNHKSMYLFLPFS